MLSFTVCAMFHSKVQMPVLKPIEDIFSTENARKREVSVCMCILSSVCDQMYC